MDVIQLVLAIVIAYLFGSISSAIIVCKMMGLPDPRTQGSRNPGATNVLRIGGKKAAIITLAGDVLKGFIPVFFVKWMGLSPLIISFTMIAAFIGHLYPIFFRFEGGKGVATALGGLLALSWQTALCWLAIWITVALVLRYAAVASIAASVLAPVLVFYFTGNWTYVDATIIMALLVIYRHRSNIQNLIAGAEHKLF